MSQDIDEYIDAWQNRLKEKEQERKTKLQNIKSAASRCSSLLRKDFGVSKVYLVGSSQNQRRFHKKSDLDLAVKGLSPENYFQALTVCWNQVPADTKVDLILLEDLSSTEKKSLLSNGQEITRE